MKSLIILQSRIRGIISRRKTKQYVKCYTKQSGVNIQFRQLTNADSKIVKQIIF